MQGKFGGPRSVRRPCLGPTLPLQTVGKSFRDDCNPSEAESCSRTAMPEDSPEFQEHIVTQESRQLTSLLSVQNTPRRTESAPPYLTEIFQQEICAPAPAEAVLHSVLGRANFALLRSPWSPTKWDHLPKHKSLDSCKLQSLAETATPLLRFSSDTQQQLQSSDWHPDQTPFAAVHTESGMQAAALQSGQQQDAQGHPHDRIHADVTLSTIPTKLYRIAWNSASCRWTWHAAAMTEQVESHAHHEAPAADGIQGAMDSLPSLTRLSLGHVRSSSPATSHQSPSGVGSQASPPHQPLLNAASPSQQGSPYQAPHMRQDRLPAPYDVQQQPPGSIQHQNAAPSARHARGRNRHQIHQGAVSDGYPNYGQPPPPPPTSQHQRPSMQWQTGHQRHQQSNGIAHMAPQHHQQQMGMGHTGMGMYRNMLPYPVMPGMQSQGNMLLPNGYMGMLAYYPTLPQGNIPIFAAEGGQRGAQRAYGHPAPFPPALDAQYMQYMQQMAQHQAFASGQTFAHSRNQAPSASGIGPSVGSAGKGQVRLNGPIANGFHRRSSSGMSAASSATSADRDSRHRMMHDRRGDSATATNSSRGSRGQLDQASSAAEAEHMAKAASLLEQLKSKTRSQPLVLQDIQGYVYDFCRDQHGSRYLQQRLAEGPPEELMQLYEEIRPHVIALMQDVFGNYVIQKLFEHGTQEVHTALTGTITTHVLALTLQMYGCRVIQKALEVLPLEQQLVIAKEVQGHVMRCVKDQNGNHVIQKSIERIKPSDEIVPIIEDVKANVGQLSTHPYGCRVVQRVLEHCTIDSVKDDIRDHILQATLPLASDQYGNYVIQHMLEHGPESARREIVDHLRGQIVQLSQHKFASNVVEKCLQYGQPESRQAVVQEVLVSEDVQGDSVPLQMMMKDQYANYVVQKMLEVCDDSQRQLLMARITAHLHQLKKLTYGKHIVARVEKLLVAGNAAASHQESQDASDAQQLQQATKPVDNGEIATDTVDLTVNISSASRESSA